MTSNAAMKEKKSKEKKRKKEKKGEHGLRKTDFIENSFLSKEGKKRVQPFFPLFSPDAIRVSDTNVCCCKSEANTKLRLLSTLILMLMMAL
jgi:hypothetical protein